MQGDERRFDPRPLEKNSKRFLFKNQVLDNIFWTSGSGPLTWTAYEWMFMWAVVLIHWIIPSHPIHMLFNAQHTALTPASAHNGYEGPVLDGKLPGGSYFHYLHHRYFECNYGESILPLDRVFGTFRDGMSDQIPAGKIHSTEEAEAIRVGTEAGGV